MFRIIVLVVVQQSCTFLVLVWSEFDNERSDACAHGTLRRTLTCLMPILFQACTCKTAKSTPISRSPSPWAFNH